MDYVEHMVLSLARTRKNPDVFIQTLELLFRGPSSEKGRFFGGIGHLLNDHSFFVLALAVWNHALEYYIRDGDIMGKGACYVGMGNAHRALGDYRKAIECYRKSLNIAESSQDGALESVCYTCLGNAYYCMGDFKQALQYHEASLRIPEHINDRNEVSKCYTNLGCTYHSLGQFRKAIEYHEKSLKIAEEIEDWYGVANCFGNLGNEYFFLGDPKKAIEYHQKSLYIVRDKNVESEFLESNCYMNLGIAYLTLANPSNAFTLSKVYFNLFKKKEDVKPPIVVAIEYLKKSLEIDERLGDRSGQSKCHENLANAYCYSGDFEKAIQHYEELLIIAKEINDKVAEAAYYIGLGNVFCQSGDSKKALNYYEKSKKITQETGDIYLERIINLNLGWACYKDNHRLAYSYLKQSIEISMIISKGLAEEEHRVGFYSLTSDAYQLMVPLCVALRKEEEAFEFTERAKSRALIDLLSTAEIRPFVPLTDELKSLLAEEEEYLVRLREIQMRGLSKTSVSIMPGEVDGVIEKLNFTYKRMEKIDPEYVFVRRGEPFSFKKIQDMVSSQKKDVAIVEYFTTENETFVFVLTSRDKHYHIETVPLSKDKLFQYAQNYRNEVVRYCDFGDIGNTWLGLSDYLIRPVSDYFNNGDLIYFVPHDLLHYLPLHLLEFEGEPLIKSHPVAYSVNSSLIKLCQNKGSGRVESCSSFGVEFEEEAKEIASIFGTEPYNGPFATKARVLANCTDKDIIHFSCHGYFNIIEPLLSGVLLHDGILTAKEIFNLRLNAELVTLSACQTGLNERTSGDELLGLTRAFLYAGAPSVIVSLWSVDARSTHKLMLEFYRLLKTGIDQ